MRVKFVSPTIFNYFAMISFGFKEEEGVLEFLNFSFDPISHTVTINLFGLRISILEDREAPEELIELIERKEKKNLLSKFKLINGE